MTASNSIKVVDALEGRLWAVLPASIGLFFCMSHPAGFLNLSGWMIFWAMIMAGYDISCRRIPNPLTAMSAICGLVFSGLLNGTSGILNSFGSASFIFIIMAILFFMGIVGGGDAKAVAALATFITLNDCISFLICISLAGGIQSIFQLIVNKRISDMLLLRASTKNWRAVGAGLTLPYGVAILGGCFLLIIYKNL